MISPHSIKGEQRLWLCIDASAAHTFFLAVAYGKTASVSNGLSDVSQVQRTLVGHAPSVAIPPVWFQVAQQSLQLHELLLVETIPQNRCWIAGCQGLDELHTPMLLEVCWCSQFLWTLKSFSHIQKVAFWNNKLWKDKYDSDDLLILNIVGSYPSAHGSLQAC